MNSEKATRDGFGDGLVELGASNERVMGFCGDLTKSTRMHLFAKKYPDRFFNVGIQEQNMVAMASGLAMTGWIPFIATYGVFFGRAWDQIRVSVCMQNQNVKMVATHAGITIGEDGMTAQAFEDIAMMRALPNITIIQPADYWEAKHAVEVVAQIRGPVYLRLERGTSPIVTSPHASFIADRAEILRDGNDCVVFACGSMVAHAIRAREMLEKEHISVMVVNVHTIKPIDERTIVACAKKCGRVVVAKAHQVVGGLGGAIAEVLSRELPTKMGFVGMKNVFGESGKPDELEKKYELNDLGICKKVREMMGKRK